MKKKIRDFEWIHAKKYCGKEATKMFTKNFFFRLKINMFGDCMHWNNIDWCLSELLNKQEKREKKRIFEETSETIKIESILEINVFQEGYVIFFFFFYIFSLLRDFFFFRKIFLIFVLYKTPRDLAILISINNRVAINFKLKSTWGS